MFEIRCTNAFADWLDRLRDDVAVARIASRIKRMEAGHFGDVAPVGDGISEMRVHHGPGYRVYFVQRKRVVIILLCGVDKSSQARDIQKAKQMALEVDDGR
jgi:putative addiction module killer protein